MNADNKSHFLSSRKINEKNKATRKRGLKKGNAILSILLMAVMIISIILPGAVWGENENEHTGTDVLGGGCWRISPR